MHKICRAERDVLTQFSVIYLTAELQIDRWPEFLVGRQTHSSIVSYWIATTLIKRQPTLILLNCHLSFVCKHLTFIDQCSILWPQSWFGSLAPLTDAETDHDKSADTRARVTTICRAIQNASKWVGNIEMDFSIGIQVKPQGYIVYQHILQGERQAISHFLQFHFKRTYPEQILLQGFLIAMTPCNLARQTRYLPIWIVLFLAHLPEVRINNYIYVHRVWLMGCIWLNRTSTKSPSDVIHCGASWEDWPSWRTHVASCPPGGVEVGSCPLSYPPVRR